MSHNLLFAMAGKTISLFVVYAGFLVFANGMEEHCSLNTFDIAGNDMHFTKEVTNEEFALVGKFKGLHCCAKGYRSIEWYKDGKIYPWELDLSRMIIYPENANQTIYTYAIRPDDEGNYTCVLRNDTVMHSHTINLKVFDQIPDQLQMTYVSQNKQAYVGENVRLFCEAFAGVVDLPDQNSEAIWYKKLENGTLVELSDRFNQKKVIREDGQTYGTYLVIPKVRKDDYGVYRCQIEKPGTSIFRDVVLDEKSRVLNYINPNPFPLKEMVLCSIIIVLILTTFIVLINQYGLAFQVYMKDRFSTVEDNDGKTHDVMVAYAPKDSELALGVLVPTLEGRGYRCTTRELSADITNWSTELSGQIHVCRRVITLISPATVNDSWISSNLYQALKQLQTLDAAKLICVALKELPFSQNESKNSVGETLASLARSMNVIQWQRSSDESFWLRLCRELPPKRYCVTQSSQRPRLTSERSFDSLVVA